MKAQQILQANQSLTQFMHGNLYLLRFPIQSMAVLIQRIKPQHIGPLPDFNSLLQRFYRLN